MLKAEHRLNDNLKSFLLESLFTGWWVLVSCMFFGEENEVHVGGIQYFSFFICMYLLKCCLVLFSQLLFSSTMLQYLWVYTKQFE